MVSTGTTTNYAGNYVYENDALQFFNQPEGYVEPINASDYNQGFSYVYQYKDHLGNIRLSYKDLSLTSTPSLQIVEENNYYPFGLKHKGYNNVINGVGHKFEYSNKETEDELGKNTIAFGWRDYDPALGRFNKIDRFAEKYYKLTPYGYAGNNPILISDIQGDSLRISFGKGNTNSVLYQNGKLLNSDGSRYEGTGVKVRKDGSVKIKNSFLKKTIAALDKLSSKFAGNELVDGIQNSTDNVTIAKGSGGNRYDPNSNTVDFNPSNRNGDINADGKTSRPTFIGLGHELAHGLDDILGTLNTSLITGYNYIKEAEKFSTHTENQLRAEHGLPLRTLYRVLNSQGTVIESLPLLNGRIKSAHYSNFYYGVVKSNIIPTVQIQSSAQILPSIINL